MSSTDSIAVTIKSRRNLYLVFATFTLLILGLIYAWSIFAAPIGMTFTDYRPLLPQVFQISMFAFCLSALVGAQIIKKFSAKISIVCAAILMAAGFILTAQFAGLGVWALFVFYGIFAGSGCGMAYNAIIALVNPWFPDRIGFSSGLMMMGFGISSLIFGSVANAMFGVMDWTLVFMIIALVAFIIMVVLAIIVKPAPKDIALQLGMKSGGEIKDSPTQQQFILKSRTFWIYAIWAIFIVTGGLTIIGTAAQGAALLRLDEMLFAGFGALLVGLVSTMNGLSRIANGIVFDKIGLVPVMLISTVVCILCMTGLSLSLAFNIGPLYIIATILAAFPYGAVPVMASAFARQRYGAKSFAMNLGIANCCIAASATINIIVSAFLGSPVSENGPIIYGVLAGFAVIALFGALAFSGFYKKDMETIKKELD
jgi:OFA family oxalate/formate antiporter-like MFS transporter